MTDGYAVPEALVAIGGRLRPSCAAEGMNDENPVVEHASPCAHIVSHRLFVSDMPSEASPLASHPSL